jgi:hypothetical protein
MHVEFTAPDHAAIIERLLEGFIKAAELLIRAGAAPWRPPLQLVLQDDDVARWQLPTETQEKLTGDCEDLVIWWAGGLRGERARPACASAHQDHGASTDPLPAGDERQDRRHLPAAPGRAA